MTVETHNPADIRDATYLACQLRTNHAVIHHKARMQQALSNLHQVYLDVTEGESVVETKASRQRDTPPTLNIPVPRVDTISSRPRSATPTVQEAAALGEELRRLGVSRSR